LDTQPSTFATTSDGPTVTGGPLWRRR
jgi:hypothetical protein